MQERRPGDGFFRLQPGPWCPPKQLTRARRASWGTEAHEQSMNGERVEECRRTHVALSLSQCVSMVREPGFFDKHSFQLSVDDSRSGAKNLNSVKA